VAKGGKSNNIGKKKEGEKGKAAKEEHQDVREEQGEMDGNIKKISTKDITSEGGKNNGK